MGSTTSGASPLVSPYLEAMADSLVGPGDRGGLGIMLDDVVAGLLAAAC